MLLLAEHFTRPPAWQWWILAYFVFAGIAGGSYTVGTLLRLWGGRDDRHASRTAFLIALPALIFCPAFLTIDLGQPFRFWHMLVDTTPGGVGPAFKYWSPMSVGAWALLLFGFFALVSFLDALHDAGRLDGFRPVSQLLAGRAGDIFHAAGAVFGTFIAGYTGVLLSVSNQPVWSDTWTLGGLFLASGLSGATALLLLFVSRRRDSRDTAGRLERADAYFATLELVLIVLFFVTVAVAGTLGKAVGGGWSLLWILALLTLAPPLSGLLPAGGQGVGSGGPAPARAARSNLALTSALVLLGVVALRAAVIFAAQ